MSRRHVSMFATNRLAAPPIALSASAAAAAAPVQVPAGSVAAKKGFCRITAPLATVRAEPRRNAAALGAAYEGNTCPAQGWAEGDGTWGKITLKRTGVTGYVRWGEVSWGSDFFDEAREPAQGVVITRFVPWLLPQGWNCYPRLFVCGDGECGPRKGAHARECWC